MQWKAKAVLCKSTGHHSMSTLVESTLHWKLFIKSNVLESPVYLIVKRRHPSLKRVELCGRRRSSASLIFPTGFWCRIFNAIIIADYDVLWNGSKNWQSIANNCNSTRLSQQPPVPGFDRNQNQYWAHTRRQRETRTPERSSGPAAELRSLAHKPSWAMSMAKLSQVPDWLGVVWVGGPN